MRELKVSINDADQRLDRFLMKVLPKAPKSVIQKWIRTKKVKVNRARAASDTSLRSGDVVNLFVYDEVLAPYEQKREHRHSTVDLRIIYEDDAIAIIDKPPGVLAHAADPKDYGNNIVDAFIGRMIESGAYVPRLEHSFKPAVANRLDFNTEGVMIGLKSHAGAMAINRAIASGRVHKFYRAVCMGRLDAPVTITDRLKRDGKRIARSEGGEGMTAVTHLRPVRTNGRFTELDIELETGRFHQIRVHLSGMGHPLVGDTQYGAKRYPELGINHHQLISYRVKFDDIEGLERLNGFEIVSERLSRFEQRIAVLFDRTGQE